MSPFPTLSPDFLPHQQIQPQEPAYPSLPEDLLHDLVVGWEFPETDSISSPLIDIALDTRARLGMRGKQWFFSRLVSLAQGRWRDLPIASIDATPDTEQQGDRISIQQNIFIRLANGRRLSLFFFEGLGEPIIEVMLGSGDIVRSPSFVHADSEAIFGFIRNCITQ